MSTFRSLLWLLWLLGLLFRLFGGGFLRLLRGLVLGFLRRFLGLFRDLLGFFGLLWLFGLFRDLFLLVLGQGRIGGGRRGGGRGGLGDGRRRGRQRVLIRVLLQIGVGVVVTQVVVAEIVGVVVPKVPKASLLQSLKLQLMGVEGKAGLTCAAKTPATSALARIANFMLAASSTIWLETRKLDREFQDKGRDL